MRSLFPDVELPVDVAADNLIGPTNRRVEAPHPIPYQGSKRLLAPFILANVAGRRFRRLYEPFAGSAAITIAASHRRLADEYLISDSCAPLAALWQLILGEPAALADQYERIWMGWQEDSIAHYYHIRDAFNHEQRPDQLLYLLVRCVKNAPRFNQSGQFNQSPDKRRLGMRPRKMRQEIFRAHTLMRKQANAVARDFEEATKEATPQDLIYMDPPYEGTSSGTDKRYHQGMDRARLIHALEEFERRGVPYILSYDGQSGMKRYGAYLPDSLDVERVELNAGRSSQATLNGRDETTIESLYVSRSLTRSRRES